MPNLSVAKPDTPHVCSHQYAFMLDNWIRRLIQHPRRILGEYINRGDTVVDIGCGPGYFTIDMAKLVGQEGRVIAVDLQEKMLAYVNKKALKKGFAGRIESHRCEAGRIGLIVKADFILAFYMVHETPDAGAFLEEVKTILKPGGKLLAVEPKFHVGKTKFQTMVSQGMDAGLKVVEYPRKKGGRAVLFANIGL